MRTSKMQTEKIESQEPPVFAATPASLVASAEATKKQWQTLQDSLISSISPNSVTFENTILPLAHLENETAILGQEAGLYASVSVDPAIRSAAREAENMLEAIRSERFSREDVYERVQAVSKLDGEDGEERRLLWKWMRMYRTHGCGLGAQKERFVVVERRLTELKNAFQRNLNEGLGDIWVQKLDLKGLPENVLAGLEVRDGEVKIPLKKPICLAISKFVHDETMRKRVFLAAERACGVNEPLFREVMVLRREYARLLDFEDYATLTLESRMAKSPRLVEKFLGDLKQALTPIAAKELESLKTLKREHLVSLGKTYDGKFFLWDFYYFHEISLQKSLNINNQTLSEYFPLETALTGMLGIFSRLFDIQFTELNNTHTNPLESKHIIWHPSVRIFSVSSPTAFIGHLYIDPYPRAGKYTHNADFNIHPGFLHADHTHHPVATALVLNLSAPSASKPALLQHSEVMTLFHELGHGMHDLLSKTRFSWFHGYRVAKDFVEMPSQMLENWCWMPEQLGEMSCHYSHLSGAYAETWRRETGRSELPNQRVPGELIRGLARARKMNLGLSTLRQIVFAEFDLWTHGDIGGLDEEGLRRRSCEVRRDIGLLEDNGEESCFYTSIPHYVVSSACGYYGYLFSQVYSSDIFQSAFSEGGDVLTGKRYKEMVLEPGGSKDEMGMITAFLGRAPDVSAFWKEFEVEVVGVI